MNIHNYRYDFEFAFQLKDKRFLNISRIQVNSNESYTGVVTVILIQRLNHTILKAHQLDLLKSAV